MIKKEWLKSILENLIKTKNTKGYYFKEDIEKAIIQSRGFDKRTIKAWFNVLWQLEYISQPFPAQYVLNFSKLVELEINIHIVDPTQTKLHTHSHTQSHSERMEKR